MAEDRLSAQAVTEGLKTRFIGQRALYYPRVTSTMEVARQAAQQGAAEGTVILADEQTAGKGRLQRAWVTPKGNIALSVILYPVLLNLPFLVMLASLAAVRAIESVTGLKTAIKWPNDILVNGKKAGGILIENVIMGDRVSSIIGIGIDVNLKLADYPEIAAIATSLSDELGKKLPRLEVIRRLLVEMENLYLALPAGGSPSTEFIPMRPGPGTGLFEEWRDRLVTLGREVRVTAPDAVYEGIAESVGSDGSLLLRLPDGGLSRVVAGDVTLRQ